MDRHLSLDECRYMYEVTYLQPLPGCLPASVAAYHALAELGEVLFYAVLNKYRESKRECVPCQETRD